MKFTYFKFKNFKGIEDQTLNLTKGVSIFALVGLNESGKTTILEAINFFSHKQKSLEGLGLDNYSVNDIHNLIPINKRDNFNDVISIEAGLEQDKIKIQTMNDPTKTKFNKKFFNRAIQEYLVNKRGFQSTKETNSNFKLALDFLKSKLKN